MTDEPLTDARLFEVVVVAVADLGGAKKVIDTEDVAMRCHQLAPALFAWRKYPEQANLELVRVSLSDAKKTKHGQLLSGSGRTGWRLTKRGLDWVSNEALTKRIATQPRALTLQRAGSIDTVRQAREVHRIEGSNAWKGWTATNCITRDDARALFRIDSYSTKELVDLKVTRILSMFEPNSEHSRFLSAASDAIRDDEAGNA